MASKADRRFDIGVLTGGRPAICNSPEELLAAAEKYVIRMQDRGPRKGKITFAGMLLELGMTWTDWKRYAKKPDFEDACARIVLLMETYHEERLTSENSSGSQYWLRVHGDEVWRDVQKQKLEAEIKGNIMVTGRAKIVKAQTNE